MLTEKTFSTGNVELFYVEGPPSSPPLVLLHGGFALWQRFLPLLPTLVLRWQLFAVDFRGHGASGRVRVAPDRPHPYRALAIIEKMDTLQEILPEEPAAFFGHSAGGYGALYYAAHHPQHVRAVIIGDSPLSRTGLDAITLAARP